MESQLRTPHILVIDDFQTSIDGTIIAINEAYSNPVITVKMDASSAYSFIKKYDSSIDLMIIDIQLPHEKGKPSSNEVGLGLIRRIMGEYPEQNIAVQTAHISWLSSIIHDISNHNGGFTTSPKHLSTEESIRRMNIAIEGAVYTRDLRKELSIGTELKPEWLTLLKLAFEEELTDKNIADRMSMSQENINKLWVKVRDALDIYRDRDLDKNLRVQTLKEAWRRGLINLEL